MTVGTTTAGDNRYPAPFFSMFGEVILYDAKTLDPAFQRYLAARLTAFYKRMRVLEIGGIDG